MASIKLIVGLGNPGADYANTRHNVGAWFIEQLATQFQQTLRTEHKFRGLFSSITLDGNKCYLLEPTTYMNESGQSVGAVTQFYKIEPHEVLIAHDELDLPAGTVRIKQTGGHGGHNGLRDIINHLHSKDFYRLRIGIGHPGHKDKVTPYVLGRPSKNDSERIQQSIHDSLSALPDVIMGDFNKAMRTLHVSP